MNSLTITVCGISNYHCSLLGFFIGIIIESKYSHIECEMFHVHVHLSFCTCLLFPSVWQALYPLCIPNSFNPSWLDWHHLMLTRIKTVPIFTLDKYSSYYYKHTFIHGKCVFANICDFSCSQDVAKKENNLKNGTAEKCGWTTVNFHLEERVVIML